jgi:rhodanese-related sulfurtransferase
VKLLLALSLPLLATAAFAQGAPAPGPVSGATAKSLVASGARVVDVRSAGEFASGHVPGAINIPYDELPGRASEIGPPSTPVVVYCASGSRSGVAARKLGKAGYTKVYDMQTATAWPGKLVK